MVKFSIIVACLNAGDDLIETVDNLLLQKYDNYEIVVKDGLSTDSSIDKLPCSDKIKLVSQKDKNVYDGMNQAVNVATGDYCLFINAGDGLYTDDVLAKLNEYISQSNGDFYYGKSHTLSVDVKTIGPKKMSKYFCYRSTVCHQAIAVKTSHLKERGYDTDIKISADREWMVYAFVEKKLKFIRVPIFISYYKGLGLSAGADAKKMIAEEDKIIKKRYFNLFQKALYEFYEILSFHWLRRLILKNRYLKRFYHKLKYKILNSGQ